MSADALDKLSERLAALPSEHEAFRDLAPVWFDSGDAGFEAQSRFIGRYGFDGAASADPEEFLRKLRAVLLAADTRELRSDTAAIPSESTGLGRERDSERIGPTAVQVTPTIYAGDNANIEINVNTGTAEFAAAMEKIYELLDLLGGSNQIAQETKRELTGEVAAGVTLVQSGRANRTYLDLLLFRPLRWMAEKFGGSAIGIAATEAMKAIIKALFQ
jgi:hypothetical protein